MIVERKRQLVSGTTDIFPVVTKSKQIRLANKSIDRRMSGLFL